MSKLWTLSKCSQQCSNLKVTVLFFRLKLANATKLFVNETLNITFSSAVAVATSTVNKFSQQSTIPRHPTTEVSSALQCCSQVDKPESLYSFEQLSSGFCVALYTTLGKHLLYLFHIYNSIPRDM